jgi:nicotinate dehydrogenase subunit B
MSKPKENSKGKDLQNFAPLSRRAFLKWTGLGIGAFVLSTDLFGHSSPYSEEEAIAAFLHIHEDGKVIAYSGKTEVGQNIRTSLAQVVAEELGLPFEQIEMVMADTKLTPYDRGTTGSRTTPQMSLTLRKAAATVREMLKEEAAKTWEIPKGDLHLERGVVSHPLNGKRLSYAELAKGKRLFEPIRDDVSLTPPEDWEVAGKSIPKAKGETYLTGKHIYASDLKIPGMQYGKILRPPKPESRLLEINTEKIKDLEGVHLVRDGDFIGVVADTNRKASRALALLEAEWETQPTGLSKEGLFDHLVEKANLSDDTMEFTPIESYRNKLEEDFHINYVAHVPLETRVGLAEWKDEELTVWTGTQKPFGVREDLSKALGLNQEKIRVITPDTGSGYGGKHTSEAGVEAAKLAMATNMPVMVHWTREEEFKWAYFRPAGVIKVRAALNGSGELAAWQFHNFNSGGSGMQTPYKVPHKKEEFHRSVTPFRQGSYRALASTANVFAIESIMTDLAISLAEDSLTFRLRHLDNRRMKDVLNAAAEKFGWENSLSEGRGKGIGCGYVKGGYVATAAEVAYDSENRAIKVLRLVTAFECGTIINPRHLESQVVGCVLQGLGGALFEEIDFREGIIENASLTSYRVPRFSDIPSVEVVLLNRKDIEPSGAGEAPILGVAPAIRNAILDASGQRINRLPMIP